MQADTEMRIVALEEETSHLRVGNEELSAELHKQWKKVELLERKIQLLENRLTSFEMAVEPASGNEKPPHW